MYISRGALTTCALPARNPVVSRRGGVECKLWSSRGGARFSGNSICSLHRDRYRAPRLQIPGFPIAAWPLSPRYRRRAYAPSIDDGRRIAPPRPAYPIEPPRTRRLHCVLPLAGQIPSGGRIAHCRIEQPAAPSTSGRPGDSRGSTRAPRALEVAAVWRSKRRLLPAPFAGTHDA